MWLFTKQGFFSVVSKDFSKDEILIKTRSKNDLINLCQKLKIDTEKVQEDFDNYPFQLVVKKDIFISYLSDYVYEIDYESVQDNIIVDKDNERKKAYKTIWQAMYNWMGIESKAFNSND